MEAQNVTDLAALPESAIEPHHLADILYIRRKYTIDLYHMLLRYSSQDS